MTILPSFSSLTLLVITKPAEETLMKEEKALSASSKVLIYGVLKLTSVLI